MLDLLIELVKYMAKAQEDGDMANLKKLLDLLIEFMKSMDEAARSTEDARNAEDASNAEDDTDSNIKHPDSDGNEMTAAPDTAAKPSDNVAEKAKDLDETREQEAEQESTQEAEMEGPESGPSSSAPSPGG